MLRCSVWIFVSLCLNKRPGPGRQDVFLVSHVGKKGNSHEKFSSGVQAVDPGCGSNLRFAQRNGGSKQTDRTGPIMRGLDPLHTAWTHYARLGPIMHGLDPISCRANPIMHDLDPLCTTLTHYRVGPGPLCTTWTHYAWHWLIIGRAGPIMHGLDPLCTAWTHYPRL